MERGVLTGAAGLRWASWVWLAMIAVADLHRVHYPALAVAAVAATGAVTVAATLPLARREWRAALDPRLVVVEVAAALLIVLADGWVEQGRLVGQNLAGSWPIPSILVAALAGGLLWGVATAAMLAAARGAAVVVSGWVPGQGDREVLAAVSTSVQWIAFGVACAVIIRLLRQAQEQISEADVRERMARDLHDGVLQTLALIERRSPSAEVARLARDQERELRAYLFGDFRGGDCLAKALREGARRCEQLWPSTAVTVSVSDDAAACSGEAVAAVSSAVVEALNNSAKHGTATAVVVFADVDDRGGHLFVSVKDNGSGFDPAAVVPRVGMTESIRGRIESLGGRVEFASVRGGGTEVRLWLPLAGVVAPA